MQGQFGHVVPIAQGFVAVSTERGFPFFDLGANGGMTPVAVLDAAWDQAAYPPSA